MTKGINYGRLMHRAFRGLIAELLVRTYHESQNRPTYVIREVLESSDNHGVR